MISTLSNGIHFNYQEFRIVISERISESGGRIMVLKSVFFFITFLLHECSLRVLRAFLRPDALPGVDHMHWMQYKIVLNLTF